MSESNVVERRVFMGIGDAVLRLIHVERMVADGAHPPPPLLAERDLIVEALNQQYQLDLGMDCDADGIPDAIDDDVSILTHAAKTSCCRISPSPQADALKSSPLPQDPWVVPKDGYEAHRGAPRHPTGPAPHHPTGQDQGRVLLDPVRVLIQ